MGDATAAWARPSSNSCDQRPENVISGVWCYPADQSDLEPRQTARMAHVRAKLDLIAGGVNRTVGPIGRIE